MDIRATRPKALEKPLQQLEGQTPVANLMQVISNDLIRRSLVPYLDIESLLALCRASFELEIMIRCEPRLLSTLDLVGHKRYSEFGTSFLLAPVFLRHVTILLLDNVSDDQALIFSRAHELTQLKILSMPQLSSPLPEVCQEIMEKYSSLQAFYVLGKPETPSDLAETPIPGVTMSSGAQLGSQLATWGRIAQFRDPWRQCTYSRYGSCIADDLRTKRITALIGVEAPATLDILKCPFVGHKTSIQAATIRLLGCEICGSCPESPVLPHAGESGRLPLIWPPPIYEASLRAAQTMAENTPRSPIPLIVRCRFCLIDRWCEHCNKWWCEDCYDILGLSDGTIHVHRGLCTKSCLPNDLLHNSGEGGMWG